MEIYNILVSVAVDDPETNIPGGEISASIEAADPQAAVESLKSLIAEICKMNSRAYYVLANEVYPEDDDDYVASVTIKFDDIEEIDWITFYYRLSELGLDDPDLVEPSELAAEWIGDFFDEDNQISVDLI